MGENIYDLMFIIGTNSILHEVKCTKKAFIKGHVLWPQRLRIQRSLGFYQKTTSLK